MKREITARVLTRTPARYLIQRLYKWSGVMVLSYHHVGDGDDSLFDRGVWSASVSAFEAQVRFLKSHFDVIGPADLPDALRRAKGRYVLITFDDGYADNYFAALPVLRANSVPATFFITTGFIDAPSLPWWDEIAWMVRKSERDAVEVPPWIEGTIEFDEPDRERAIRKLLRTYKTMSNDSSQAYLAAISVATGSGRCDGDPRSIWMTWDMVREMRAAGMMIGGHTVSHPILAQVSAEEQWAEISQCGRRLQDELGQPMRYFSYPVGDGPGYFDDTSRNCLRKCGVDYAFSHYGGISGFDDWDDLDIRRIPVEREMSFDYFRTMATLPRLYG